LAEVAALDVGDVVLRRLCVPPGHAPAYPRWTRTPSVVRAARNSCAEPKISDWCSNRCGTRTCAYTKITQQDSPEGLETLDNEGERKRGSRPSHQGD
jgi:hypothetical protein